MSLRTSLAWLVLVLAVSAPHAHAQCVVGLSFTPLGPGCGQTGTPMLTIESSDGGSTVEFGVESSHANSLGLLVASLPLEEPILVADCDIYIDPAAIVIVIPFVTNGEGDHGFTVGVPNVPELIGMSFVLQAGLFFEDAPIGGVSATNGFLATAGCIAQQTEGQSGGCGPDFWKLEENIGSWPPEYSPDTLFSSVFENAFPGLTLDQVLEQAGSGLNALGRQVVAAVLNAATIDGFGLTTAQVISMFNAVFPGGDYESLTVTFEELNSGTCPLGEPPAGGCGPEFWSLEENVDDWPPQYSPDTLFSSVFENAFPGLTLDQVLEQAGGGLNGLGRQVVAALLNAATIDGFGLTTAQVIMMFNAVFPGGDYEALTVTFERLNSGNCPFGEPPTPTSQGCSHGFWKNHSESWPPQYSPDALFSSVFENAFPGMTFQEVLEQGGGGLAALGRQLVAALLNAATIEDFELTTAEIISMFNAVFPGGDYEELKDTLEELNSGSCLLDDPPSSEGCGPGFWSLEENVESWPSEYSPDTLFSSVFENAFPGLTLDQVLEQAGSGLNALGRQVVAALLNAATIDDFDLTTAEVISMFNAVFPGGDYEALTVTFEELNSGDCPFDDPSVSEGCSHGFWKNHSESWPAQYSPDALFSSVFENAFPGMTFQEVLEQGGGGLAALGRQLVAALLNAATIDDFDLTTAEVISMFNATFPGGNYEELKDTLEELNSGSCQLDDPPSSEGCGPDFWKLEENFESWPPEYSPDALFSSVFENAFPGLTLRQVLEQAGSGLNALGRQVVAALLNAATIEDFDLTTAEVISMFNAVFPGGDYEALTVTFEELNSGDCPF